MQKAPEFSIYYLDLIRRDIGIQGLVISKQATSAYIQHLLDTRKQYVGGNHDYYYVALLLFEVTIGIASTSNIE